MQVPELSVRSPVETLQSISHVFSFSTFVHFKVLADVIRAEKAAPQQWQDVLKNCSYSPASFLAQNKRGNCVDFALYGQQALGNIGVHADIIGSEPSGTYTPSQQSFMRYRHTSLVADSDKRPVMYEPVF